MHQQNVNLGFKGTMNILLPYVRENFLEQLKSIWFIIVYLMLFQILILNLPLVYAGMIAVGIFIVTIGLMFFMEGLRLGLMPLGETIGAVLPRNSSLPLILLFAFLLGMGATFAEPAIGVLRSAGSGVKPYEAPLLYSLLNDFSLQLVLTVSLGVGLAVLLGVLRFFYGWPLKYLILPLISLMLVLTLMLQANPILEPVLGLAWDCGAVTTGPVTVPLVLALGIGVCRIVGDGNSSNAGFGIVTLASLFPIIAVMLLGSYHYLAKDYYGQAHYRGESAVVISEAIEPYSSRDMTLTDFSEQEYQAFLEYGVLPKDYQMRFEGGEPEFKDGKIILSDPVLIFEKIPEKHQQFLNKSQWDPDKSMVSEIRNAILEAVRAIIPLCLFLFLTLKLILPEQLKLEIELKIGILFAIAGMSLFVLGISIGLTPLGSQLGSNVPSTFASITPWGLNSLTDPLFESAAIGKLVAILFGFLLGYGATLAEPALNALGRTVEQITVGAFKKPLLMQSVAVGVGFGIAAGVCKLAYNIPLSYLLIPPYLALLFLTWISSDEFVNFAWDSAGVTTGPITVPLVLAMGLGIGANVPGIIDGFGILALASVGPIISVLTVGLLVSRARKQAALDIALEEVA